jgi:hypothetical protein
MSLQCHLTLLNSCSMVRRDRLSSIYVSHVCLDWTGLDSVSVSASLSPVEASLTYRDVASVASDTPQLLQYSIGMCLGSIFVSNVCLDWTGLYSSVSVRLSPVEASLTYRDVTSMPPDTPQLLQYSQTGLLWQHIRESRLFGLDWTRCG